MREHAAERLLTIFANPLVMKGVHARMRRKHLISWGIVTVTVTAFVAVIAYVIAREQGNYTPQIAAKTMFLPVLVIQAVLLMLLGLGAVASQVSYEREMKLLDYQRMTPMAPLGKILGYLFGLPAREYFLFLLTVPFTLYSVLMGEIPLHRVLLFYVVFFSTVVLYHLTGMVAGMASSRPRRATMVSQGLVVLLYVLLPQASRFGLTFFEFFTFIPTLEGVILQELASIDATAQGRPFEAFEVVRFFSLAIHPTTFTLIVQGFLIMTMFVVVYRKWIDEDTHVFSKLYGLVFYVGILLFLTGSLWPAIVHQEFYGLMAENWNRDFDFGRNFEDSPRHMQVLLFVLMTLFGMLCGVFSLLVVHFTTPSREMTLKGLRRAMKLGHGGLRWNEDGASSFPITLITIVATWIAWWSLVAQARATGVFFKGFAPALIMVSPLVFHSVLVVFIQALRERYSLRGCFLMVFLLWMLPSFTALVLAAASANEVLVSFVAIPFPPWAIYMMNQVLFVSTEQLPDAVDGLRSMEYMLPRSVGESARTMIALSMILYGGLGVLLQLSRWRWRRGLHDSVFNEPARRFTPPVTPKPALPAPDRNDPQPEAEPAS